MKTTLLFIGLNFLPIFHFGQVYDTIGVDANFIHYYNEALNPKDSADCRQAISKVATQANTLRELKNALTLLRAWSQTFPFDGEMRTKRDVKMREALLLANTFDDVLELYNEDLEMSTMMRDDIIDKLASMFPALYEQLKIYNADPGSKEGKKAMKWIVQNEPTVEEWLVIKEKATAGSKLRILAEKKFNKETSRFWRTLRLTGFVIITAGMIYLGLLFF